MSDKIEIYDANGVKRLAGAAVAAVDAADVTYTPADNADWNGGSDPGNTGPALDQLAERMVAAEGVSKFATIADEKSQNTGGGASTNGSWLDRDLNTEVSDPDGIVSISSNAFTLIAGTYNLHIQSPFLSNATGGAVRIRLRNVTDSVTVKVSPNASMASALIGCECAIMVPGLTTDGTKAYKVQYYMSVGARTVNGLGIVLNESGVNETYTVVDIEKLP